MVKSQPTAISETLFKLSEKLLKRKKYVKNEFQAYGLELAEELEDWKNRSLYIRLAKTVDRRILDTARYFVKDHNPGQIKTPYKLFMWKLKELRKTDI
jgi:hypothetical protein